MGSILAAIENSAIKEVEAGGMIWRLKKICSADLAEVGHSALALSQGMDDKGNASKPVSDEEASRMMASQSADKLKSMAKLKDAVTAAGLIAIGDPTTGEFEKVRCVLDRDKSDASKGVLWVGAIPNDVADTLFTECLSLATDGGAAVERLHAFREKSRQPVGAGSDRETLQHAPRRGS